MKNPSNDEIVEGIITPNTNPNEDQNPEFKANFNGTIRHDGFASDDLKQKFVQYAYKLGGIDFVITIECENGNRDINAIGDNGHAFGLCQMNDNFHKIPTEYKTNGIYQVEHCFKKWKSGTRFYGPDRIIKGQKCKNYVKSRFTIIE